MKTFTTILFLSAILISCNTDSFQKAAKNQFKGKWRLAKRGILDSLEIEITEDSLKNYTGRVIKVNNNKYVKLFMDDGDLFIKKIKRYSNKDFKLTEKKIAGPLFSIYGESTNKELDVHFHHKDTIYVGEKGNGGIYVRIIE
ncbi:hypothetical protein [Lishizhenia sp.]|uniref:hypothetical protein n=1 Tax=Lishizhenia sp. TaxID=2497594 RepID=UPI00299F096F|nr:hypothetical protein [Lishizhenia sp.]MDX1445769.1 hypothetical protein [Lishizhenia sp.]